MSEPEHTIEDLLAHLQTEGKKAGSGDFKLDPRRALEILTEQGRLGQNAPLFLFRALYLHTGGQVLRWKKALFNYQILWEEALGEPPRETYRVLAEGAFQALSISLSFGPGRLHLSNAEPIAAPFSSRFSDTFGAARERLHRYPIEGLFEPFPLARPWLSRVFCEGELEFRLGAPSPQNLHWLICGIDFSETHSLPIDVTVIDDEIRSDLSLTLVPDSSRKAAWLERIEIAFQEELYSLFLELGRIQLDPLGKPTKELASLDFLPYILNLDPQSPLRELAIANVTFPDVFGQFWTLADLLKLHAKDGGLLTVPSVPTDCPEHTKGQRPVLFWDGQAKYFGSPVFRNTKSGAGYLYSLRRGELGQAIQREQNDPQLATVDWEHGTLGLKSIKYQDRPCEVELVSTRRTSEKIFLDAPAPKGLRLVFHTRNELPTWQDEQAVFSELRHQVVVLVDRVLEEFGPEPSWLVELMEWVPEVRSLNDYVNLRKTGLVESVTGNWVSVEELESVVLKNGSVPVLEDRSTSLPRSLPFKLVVWACPLLERLDIETKDIGSLVRRAYWKEQGRDKWLARYEPCAPEHAKQFDGLRFASNDKGYLVAQDDSSRTKSRLFIWREGRPFGSAELTSSQSGLVLVWVDDEFPADDYWSGPEPKALAHAKEEAAASIRVR